MTTKPQNARAGMLAGLTVGHKQGLIDQRLHGEADRGRSVTLLDADAIKGRSNDTRPARAEHVLALAESIGAVGLVQALTVDRNARLVAGLHRLEAVRLLLAPQGERPERFHALEGAGHLEPKEAAARLKALPLPDALPEPLRGRRVPCRVLLELDAEAHPEAALAAEVAENTARRAYTPHEVAAFVERLRSAGYRESEGRPKRGEKALRPALELVLGVSGTTVRRMLGVRVDEKKPRHLPRFSEPLDRLRRAALAVVAIGKDLPRGEHLPALRRACGLAADLAEALDAARGEAARLDAEEEGKNR